MADHTKTTRWRDAPWQLVCTATLAACLVAAPASGSHVGAGAGGDQAVGDFTAGAVAGQLIVGFERGSSPAVRAGALAAAAAAKVNALGSARVKLVRLAGRRGVERAIATLERNPAVAYAEPNYVRRLRAKPDDPSFRELWNLRSVKAPGAWNLTTGSSDVTIAVADDGVDYTHPDLAANVLAGRDFAAGDDQPLPEANVGGALSPHGTHVAGVIGAVGDNDLGIAGVNWDVGILPLRIFSRSGTTTTAKIVKAFAFAAERGARALNASFGGEAPSQAEHDAIAAARRTLFVVAAPNEAINLDVSGDFPCGYELANVICVTASDRSGKVAGFAAYGKRTVDLAAPGTQILSTVPGAGYRSMTGTSMSAPHVSGAVGLIAAANPALSAAQVRAALLGAGRKSRALRKRVSKGRLNLRRAVKRALKTE